MIKHIHSFFKDHIALAKNSEAQLTEAIERVCLTIKSCIVRGNKVLLFGNGGSAADAQHIAAEFTGRFLTERKGLAAIALTTDTSAITAIGNDYGFDNIFARQVEALAVSGDVLIGISTSGNSKNVINALELGNLIGCICIGFSGRDGGHMNDLCKINLVVPSDVTARIQEIHILIGHIICSEVENMF